MNTGAPTQRTYFTTAIAVPGNERVNDMECGGWLKTMNKHGCEGACLLINLLLLCVNVGNNSSLKKILFSTKL